MAAQLFPVTVAVPSTYASCPSSRDVAPDFSCIFGYVALADWLSRPGTRPHAGRMAQLDPTTGVLLPLSRGWGFHFPHARSVSLAFLLPRAYKIELPPLRFLLPLSRALRLPLSSFDSNTGPRCSKPLLSV